MWKIFSGMREGDISFCPGAAGEGGGQNADFRSDFAPETRKDA
jgi:hypothetical protein